ncbi:MAG: hypothetical protein WBC33_06290 [Conexibacter sp.]
MRSPDITTQGVNQMRHPAQLLLAPLVAVAFLAAVAAVAHANRGLQVEPSGSVTGTAPVTFTTLSGTQYWFLLTLRGSLHRTVSKVVGSLAGLITDCRGQPLREFPFLNIACVLTMPWHVRYTSFSGTLPGITAASFVILGFSISFREILECLFQADLRVIAAENPVSSIRFDETQPVSTSTPGCVEIPITFRSSLRLDRRQTLSLI